jgi:hypothetical protein
MLDLIGAIVGMSAVGINLVAFTHATGGTLARRLGLDWVSLQRPEAHGKSFMPESDRPRCSTCHTA